MRKPTPKFLLIDIGNTRVKWATVAPRGQIRVSGNIATNDATTKWITSLARNHSKHSVIVASVVPKILPSFRRVFSGRLTEVTVTLPKLGLEFHYPKPAEIGSDRIAGALAASAHGKLPAIIIACGTATAFTVVDAKGRLCGGAIAPGLQTQLAALLGATSQLPATKLSMPRSALAKSTQDAISAGVILSYRGGLKEILAELIKTLPAHTKPRVILTGGNAPLVAKTLGTHVELRPLLIFEGLLMIGTRLWMPRP